MIHSSDFKIRTMNIGDIPSLMMLKNEIGWNQTRKDWARLISLEPDGCFVAETENYGRIEIIGSVTTTSYNDELAWIGMLIVRPKYRMLGIGNALLEKVLDYLKGKSIGTIQLDASDLGKPLYLRKGFIDDCTIHRYILRDTQHNSETSNDPNKIINLNPKNLSYFLDMIIEYDQKKLNFDRSKVLSALLEDENCIKLVKFEKNEINGYVIVRKGYNNYQIGPLVADNVEICEELLDGIFSCIREKEVFIDFYDSILVILKNLKRFQLQLVKTFSRMQFGKAITKRIIKYEYLISGPEKG